MKITVTNPDGSEPDWEQIQYEEWACGLDKPEFALTTNGVLIAVWHDHDDYYYISRIPPGRFTVRVEGEDK